MSKKRLMANGYEFYTKVLWWEAEGLKGCTYRENKRRLNEYAYKEWMKMEKIFCDLCDLQQERIIRRRALA